MELKSRTNQPVTASDGGDIVDELVTDLSTKDVSVKSLSTDKVSISSAPATVWSTDKALKLGSNSYITGNASNEMGLKAGSNIYFRIGDSTKCAITTSAFRPADSSYTLGNSSNKWAKAFISELNAEKVVAEDGTIQDVLGLDNSGNLVKGNVSGGTQLYHYMFFFNKIVGMDTLKLTINFVSSENITIPTSPTLLQVLEILDEIVYNKVISMKYIYDDNTNAYRGCYEFVAYPLEGEEEIELKACIYGTSCGDKSVALDGFSVTVFKTAL